MMEGAPLHEEQKEIPEEAPQRMGRRKFLKSFLAAAVLRAEETFGQDEIKTAEAKKERLVTKWTENKENGKHHLEITGSHSRADEAHRTSNKFTEHLGDVLRAEHPSQAVNISARISDDSKFQVTLGSDIVKCKPEDATEHIEHVGTLLVGDDLRELQAAVTEINKAKIDEVRQRFQSDPKLLKKYSPINVPPSYVVHASCRTKNNKLGWLEEIFYTYKDKK